MEKNYYGVRYCPSEKQLQEMIHSVFLQLSEIHMSGDLHNDLKPDNIIWRALIPSLFTYQKEEASNAAPS